MSEFSPPKLYPTICGQTGCCVRVVKTKMPGVKECPICLNTKTLQMFIPCHHTMCTDCFDLIKQSKPSYKELECPACKVHIRFDSVPYPSINLDCVACNNMTPLVAKCGHNLCYDCNPPFCPVLDCREVLRHENDNLHPRHLETPKYNLFKLWTGNRLSLNWEVSKKHFFKGLNIPANVNALVKILSSKSTDEEIEDLIKIFPMLLLENDNDDLENVDGCNKKRAKARHYEVINIDVNEDKKGTKIEMPDPDDFPDDFPVNATTLKPYLNKWIIFVFDTSKGGKVVERNTQAKKVRVPLGNGAAGDEAWGFASDSPVAKVVKHNTQAKEIRMPSDEAWRAWDSRSYVSISPPYVPTSPSYSPNSPSYDPRTHDEAEPDQHRRARISAGSRQSHWFSRP